MPRVIPFDSCLAVFEFSTEYEISTLNMIRKRLFLQREEAGRCTIEWSRRVGGRLTKRVFLEVSDSYCESAVQNALNEFRPLAFALAFKIQDVLAETVLEANGIPRAKALSLSYGEKRKKIEALKTSGGLYEPDVLANHQKISEAWWRLYFDLEPFRGAIHHSGTIIREAEGGMSITTLRPRRLGSTLALSASDQGSYARIACLVAEGVLDYGSFDALRRRLVANDVSVLEPLHGVAGASEGPASLERVKLVVAEECAQCTAPYSCEIDFDEVTATAGAPLINIEIEVESAGRTLVWRIPADSYPRGKRTVREGDPEFDQWRVQ